MPKQQIIKLPPSPYIVLQAIADRTTIVIYLIEPAHSRSIKLSSELHEEKVVDICEKCHFYKSLQGMYSELTLYNKAISLLKDEPVKELRPESKVIVDKVFPLFNQCPSWLYSENVKCLKGLSYPENALKLNFSDLSWRISINTNFSSDFSVRLSNSYGSWLFSNVDGWVCFGSDAHEAIKASITQPTLDLLDIINSFWLTSFNGDLVSNSARYAVDHGVPEEVVGYDPYYRDCYDEGEDDEDDNDHELDNEQICAALPYLASAGGKIKDEPDQRLSNVRELLYHKKDDETAYLGPMLANKDGHFIIKDLSSEKTLKIKNLIHEKLHSD